MVIDIAGNNDNQNNDKTSGLMFLRECQMFAAQDLCQTSLFAGKLADIAKQ